jgi:cytochrome c6
VAVNWITSLVDFFRKFLEEYTVETRRTLLKKLISAVLLAIAVVTFAFGRPALAADAANGGKIFNANCVACHINGGNVIIPTKTLKSADLEKNGKNSIEAIVTQVTKGNGAMPAFGGRLTSAQIEDVATYVLSQSEAGW